ncbi:MAG: glycosyltransferase family 4 protein [Pseudomonadota bacterium]
MSLTEYAFTLLAAFVLTGMLAGIYRSYAMRHGIMDVPTQRSSHVRATPRGGGGAIIVGLVAVVAWLWWQGSVSSDMLWVLLVAGGGVGGIGWLDDLYRVSVRGRMVVHFLSAVALIMLLGGIPKLPLFGQAVELGGFGYVLTLLYIVWLLNLYNFMDGIDGIAGIEALTVCVGALVIFSVGGAVGNPGLLLALAGAVSGFLIWNFPRACLFMGDSGSGFIGVLFAAISLQAGMVAPELIFVWLILLGCFVVDATMTILFRFARGERIHEAHRDHAYQHAALRHKSHIMVSLSVGAINLVWLLPVAVLVSRQVVGPVVGLAVAYMPLVFVCLHYKAGRPFSGN